MTLSVAIVGFGGITRTLLSALSAEGEGFSVRNVLVRESALADPACRWPGVDFVCSLDRLDPAVELVVEAAGQGAVAEFGPAVAKSGRDLALVSAGALADDALRHGLAESARTAGGKVQVVSGAIGALDALATARAAGLPSVRYTGIKPTGAWRGTPAEAAVDLEKVRTPTVIFTGSAREVVRLYPKNANVAATVALAGSGFDDTAVTLVADPDLTHNKHIVEAQSDLGDFRFETTSLPLPSNPRTSGSTAFSLLAFLRHGTNAVPL